jgi:putative flippase GtrA
MTSRIIRTKERFHARSQQTAGRLMQLIDFFYPPFQRFMPQQTFRYAACGGANQMLNLIVYYISYNFIFRKQNWDLGFITFKPHIAAFLVAFAVTFPIGFLLSRYVVFNQSAIKGRHQAVRYITVVVICLLLNYGLLKLFVEVFHWYPTPSMLLTILLVVTFSFLSQKRFAFKSVG